MFWLSKQHYNSEHSDYSLKIKEACLITACYKFKRNFYAKFLGSWINANTEITKIKQIDHEFCSCVYTYPILEKRKKTI